MRTWTLRDLGVFWGECLWTVKDARARVGARYQAILPGEPGATDPPHAEPVRLNPPPSWAGFAVVVLASAALSLVV